MFPLSDFLLKKDVKFYFQLMIEVNYFYLRQFVLDFVVEICVHDFHKLQMVSSIL
jgi:hypothetical protein